MSLVGHKPASNSEALVLDMWEVFSTPSCTFRPKMIVHVMLQIICGIALFENYSYSIGSCAKEKKKLLKNNYTPKCKYKRTMKVIP